MNSVRITALGAKSAAFAAVLFAAWRASPYSNLFFLLLCVALALVVVHLFLTSREFVHRPTRIGPMEPVAAGSPSEQRLAFDSPSGRIGRGSVVWIPERGRRIRAAATLDGASLVLHLPALPRGVVKVRRTLWATSWPFGLIAFGSNLEGPEEIVVGPALLADGVALRAAGDGAPAFGLQPSRERALPGSMRPYRAGDDPRGVHWRASARRGEPVVVEWEEECTAAVYVELDPRTPADRFEEHLSQAATRAAHARAHGLSVRVRGPGSVEDVPPTARAHRSLTRQLASARPREAEARS